MALLEKNKKLHNFYSSLNAQFDTALDESFRY